MMDTRRWNIAFGIAMLTLVGTAWVYFRPQATPVTLPMPLSALPLNIDGWVGQPAAPQSPPLRLADSDDELIRVYRNASGDSVGLYIAYFSVQGDGKKLVDFRSRDLTRSADQVEVLDRLSSARLGRTILSKGNRHWVVYYWFDINGRIVHDRYMAKLHTLKDALWRDRTNGALVLIFLDSATLGPTAGISALETTFLHSLVSTVHTYLSS